MTLHDLLPSLQKVSSASGGEWAGPCPWCGGKDRFRVWPDHPSCSAGGRFYCRQCGKTGDAPDFLRERDGLTYPEACAVLGVSLTPARQRRRPPETPPSAWTPRPDRLPSEAWRKRGEAFLAHCARHIEAGAGREALEGRRLTQKTARRFRIGWNPSPIWETPELWGREGEAKKLCLPAGLVVPVFRKDGLLRLKIRRTDAVEVERFGKWQAVKGGGDGPLVVGKAGLPVVVCEAEIDALYMAQEAGEYVAAVGLGSAANRPTTPVVDLLRAAPLVLVALDRDAGGTDHVPWWLEHFSGAVRWGAVNAKSPGDMEPEALRLWVAAGLASLPGRRMLREGLPPTSCGEAKEITRQGETPVRDNGTGFAFRPQNTQSLSRQGKEAKSPAEGEYGPKRRNTPYVRDGVWLRDAPPSTPLDTLRCWGLLPRLEHGELVLEGWEELDEPTRAGITRWLEHAGHRERVAGLLNKTHVAQGGI